MMINTNKFQRQPIVAVSGSGKKSSDGGVAYQVGKILANQQCTLLTGGGHGIMIEVSQGAAEHGGLTVGVLPSKGALDINYCDKFPNRFVHVPIYTGMAVGRNSIMAYSADVMIAFKGGPGTISEISMALNIGKPVIVAFWDNFSLPFDYAENKLFMVNTLNDLEVRLIDLLAQWKKIEVYEQ